MRRTEVKIIRTNEDKRMTTWAMDWFLPLPEHHHDIIPQLDAREMSPFVPSFAGIIHLSEP